MTRNKSKSILGITTLAIIGSLLCVSCTSKKEKERQAEIEKEKQEELNRQLLETKNAQKGMSLSTYFDALARQPDAKSSLDEAKGKLDVAFDKADTFSKYYALGTIGGAKNEDRYQRSTGDGIYDSIARQPEESITLIKQEDKSIKYILDSDSDIVSEMIGLGSASLYDAIARQPEISSSLDEYTTYIYEAMFKLENKENAYLIGHASIGFYDSLARQPEINESAWTEFKAYIDSLN